MTDTTLVTLLLDRTGSMEVCKAATIEGFNGYVTSLKEEQDAEILFTFLQFDSQSLDKVHVAVPISDVQLLTNDTYVPRASTPLIEAATKTINAVAKSLEKYDVKPKVVVCFQTDGEENASARDYTWEKLTALIEEKQAEGWQFNFLGAGINAYQHSARMGISANATMSYDHTRTETTNAAFAEASRTARGFAAGTLSDTHYTNVARAASGDVFAGLTPGLQSQPLQQQPNLTPPVQTVRDPLDLTVSTALPRQRRAGDDLSL
jgi:hypothetical protein